MERVCPHCQSVLPPCDPSTKVVICPGCGSSIQGDADATDPWLPAEAPRRLGKFELLEQVGQGAFGTVYPARDVELDRRVALKIPRAGAAKHGRRGKNRVQGARHAHAAAAGLGGWRL